MATTPVLYLLCGKMAAGKSTFAIELAKKKDAILLSEDELLGNLYPNTIVDVPSYIEHARRLKTTMQPLLIDMLKRGQSLVLDFPANTRQHRRSWLQLANAAGAAHELHYIDTPDAICKAQLKKRSLSQPERAATDTEAMFDAITVYFEAPANDESLNVVRHDRHENQP